MKTKSVKKNIYFKHLDEDRKCIQLMNVSEKLLKDRTRHKVLQFTKKGAQHQKKLCVSLQIRSPFIRMHVTKQPQSRAGDMVDLLPFEMFVSKASIFLKGTFQLKQSLRQRLHMKFSMLCYTGGQSSCLFWYFGLNIY